MDQETGKPVNRCNVDQSAIPIPQFAIRNPQSEISMPPPSALRPPTSDLRPRLGYTSREADIAYFHKFQHDYWFSISLGGGEPVRLYPETVHDYNADLDKLDGLVLTGGGDMDPALYGQGIDGADEKTIYPERDRMELGLIKAAISRNMPIFGVCRGIQVINVALGGTLAQHIEGHTGKNNTFDAPRPHAVSIEPGSLLDRTLACGPTIDANSYHHQAVLPADLAPGLVITGQTTDGVIEALEHKDHPWLLGVQWHPERLYEFCDEHRRIWKGFVEAASAYRDEAIEHSDWQRLSESSLLRLWDNELDAVYDGRREQY